MRYVLRPDVFPTINVAMLRRSGLFEKDHSGWIGFSFCEVDYIIRRRKEGRAIEVVAEQQGRFTTQEVELSQVALRFGKRTYFVCPATQRRCEDLYLIGRAFLSRICIKWAWGVREANQFKHDEAAARRFDRLVGTIEKGAARGANRTKLAATVKPDPWVRIAALDRADALDATLKRTKQTRRRKSLLHPLHDRLAMAYGFTNGQRVRVAIDHETSPVLLARYGTFGELGPRNLETAFVEDQLYLTVKDLKQRGLIAPGMVKAWTLNWSDDIHLIVECHVFNPERAFLSIRSRYGDRPPQVLRLVATPGRRRWYVICPYTGQRMTKMFFRDGLFGSATGNCLLHRSQRKANPTVPGWSR